MMHASLLTVALVAGLTFAQYSGLPTCAQNCASQQFSGGSYDGCGTDPKCICSNQDFLSNVVCCLNGACDAADISSAIVFATQICTANGVSVNTAVTCAATTGSAASATATVTSGSLTTGTAATASPTTTASSTGTASTAAAAWGPRQTGAVGIELLGGLAAAGLALL